MQRFFTYHVIITFYLGLILPSQASADNVPALDSAPVTDDFIRRTWGVDDGLPSNTVLGIAQTQDGYLWLATWNGLSRFDGLRFTTFSKNSSLGLETNHVQSVFVARDGALWAGLSSGGIAKRSPSEDSFETIIPLQPPHGYTAWSSSFAEDAGAAIWFGFDPDIRLCRWYKGKLSTLSDHDGLGGGVGTYVYAETNGTIWYSASEACGVFDGTRFNGVDPEGGSIGRLASAREGGMWAARGQRLLHYWPNGAKVIIAETGKTLVTALYEDSTGDVWIGTRGDGLFCYHAGGLVRVPTSNSGISSIMEDREGNLWVGTTGSGLDRLRRRGFFLHQVTDGVHSNIIASLCEDAQGKLWMVGLDGNPVWADDSTNRSLVNPPAWSVVVPPQWSAGPLVVALCPDTSGNVWMATVTSGLMRWNDGIFSYESLSENITALLLDRQGDLWAAPINGPVIRHRDGINTYIPQDGGLVDARALAQDSMGGMWVGTEGGLVFHQDHDRFIPVPLPGAGPGQPIRFIVADENDTVWIGAYEGGLYRWHAGQVARLPDDSGLSADDLRSLLIEPHGDLWFGTGRGLIRVAHSEINAVIEGRKPLMSTIAYGRNDGLPNVDFSYGFRNATTQTRDGHLWFATYGGALEVDPQKLRQTVAPPPVLIEEIQLSGQPVFTAQGGELTLPPNPGPLEIHYTQPYFDSPEDTQFRYRLLGLGHDEWIFADRQRLATFANLPPGEYRFQVATAELEESQSPNTASLVFEVKAAWWQTNIFRSIAVVSSLLALAWLIRQIIRRSVRARLQKLEQKHAVERERTRIARDMHDQLGANLTQIGLFANMAKVESPESSPAAAHASRVVTSVREAVDALDEIVWAIDPSNDTLPHLLEYLGQYSADFLHSAGLHCQLDLPVNPPDWSVGTHFRHNLFLIAQEALNNVIKHAAAQKVLLRITVTESALNLEINDDGHGIPDAQKRAGASGLTNLSARAAEMGGTCRIESQFDQGTCLTFCLPWPHVQKSNVQPPA